MEKINNNFNIYDNSEKKIDKIKGRVFNRKIEGASCVDAHNASIKTDSKKTDLESELSLEMGNTFISPLPYSDKSLFEIATNDSKKTDMESELSLEMGNTFISPSPYSDKSLFKIAHPECFIRKHMDDFCDTLLELFPKRNIESILPDQQWLKSMVKAPGSRPKRRYDGTDFLSFPHLYCWLYRREEKLNITYQAKQNKDFSDGPRKVREAKHVLIIGPGILLNDGIYHSPQMVEVPKVFQQGTEFHIIDRDQQVCSELIKVYETLDTEINSDVSDIHHYKFNDRSYAQHRNLKNTFVSNITECHYEKHFFEKQDFKSDFPKEVEEKLTKGLDYLPSISITCEDVRFGPNINNLSVNYDYVVATNVIDHHLLEKNLLTSDYIRSNTYQGRHVNSAASTARFKGNFNFKMNRLYNLLLYLKDDGYLIIDNLTYQLLILGYKHLSVETEPFEVIFNRMSALWFFNKSEKPPLIEVEVINAFGEPVPLSCFNSNAMRDFYGEGATEITSVYRTEGSRKEKMKFKSLALVAIKKIKSSVLSTT